MYAHRHTKLTDLLPPRLVSLRGAMDKAKKHELFGSDSEDDDEEEVQPPATEGGVGADDDDLGSDNLFGSEDEEAEAESQPVAANAGNPVHYALPSMPRPPADSKVRPCTARDAQEGFSCSHELDHALRASPLTLEARPECCGAAVPGPPAQHPSVPASPL